MKYGHFRMLFFCICMTTAPEIIELEYAVISYSEPVVEIKFKDGVELGFPEIRELTRMSEKLSNHKPYLVFSDVRVNINVTSEGRRVAGNPAEAPLHRGTALLVNNVLIKEAMNFFGGLRRPAYPYRVFTDKQKAITWLLRQPLG